MPYVLSSILVQFLQISFITFCHRISLKCMVFCQFEIPNTLINPILLSYCHSGLVSSRNEHVCPCHSMTRAVHDMADKRVLGVFTFNCLQTGHCVRVDYYMVMNWTHVLVIVQRQSDGYSLSCKDGAVVWQSFGQSAAGCPTILEMTVDDRHCAHSHSFWSHQCKLHHVILVIHDTH